MRLINIGFGNMVSESRIIAVVGPESAPIDATQGRRTRAVVITDSDHVILTYLQSETVAGRINGMTADGDFGDDADDGE